MTLIDDAVTETDVKTDFVHDNPDIGELAARFCYAAAGLPTPVIEEILTLFENISDNHRKGQYHKKPC